MEAIFIFPIECSKINAFSTEEEDAVETGLVVADVLVVLILVCP